MTRTDCEKQFVLDVANRFAINDESNCNPIADQEHLSPEDANWRNVRKRVERINFNLHQNREKLRELPSALHLKYKLVQLRGRVTDQGDGSGWGFMKFWYNRIVNKVNSFYNHGAIFKLWESRIKGIEGEFGTGVGTYFRFLRTSFFQGLFVGILGLAFIILPKLVQETDHWSPDSALEAFTGILTGRGSINNTILFYGHFTDQGKPYNISKSYFFTTFCCQVFGIFIVAIKFARVHKSDYVASAVMFRMRFADMVFTGWEFAILPASKNFNQRRLANLFKENLESVRKRSKKLSWSMVKTSSFTIKFGVWMLTFVVIALCGWVTKVLLDKHIKEDWWPMVSAFIISMMVFALPLVVGLFSRYVETYSKARHRNYVDLIRSFLLILVVLAMVIYTYFHHHQKGSCWENDFGQEIYRFNILFPLCLVLLPFLIESLYGVIYSRTRLRDFFPSPEFDIGLNTTYLIYGQILMWLGMYFVPLIPLISSLFLVFTFYIRSFTLRSYDHMDVSSKPWRANRTNSILHSVSLLAMVLTLTVYAYVVSIQEASSECGPFKETSQPISYLTRLQGFRQVFGITTLPIFLNVFMIVLIYFVKSYTKSVEEQVSRMKKQVKKLANEGSNISDAMVICNAIEQERNTMQCNPLHNSSILSKRSSKKSIR